MPRGTNIGRPLHSEFLGGESDTVREIPPDWRAALDLKITELPVPVDWVIPQLSDTMLAVKLEQKVTSESQLRTTEKQPGVVTRTEHFTDQRKQFGTRTLNFKHVGDPITTPSATVDVDTKDFGNEHFEEKIEDVGTLFVGAEYGEEIMLPWELRHLIPTSSYSEREIGIAADPTLSSGDLMRREKQENVFVKDVDHHFIDLSSLPIHLYGQRTTEEFGGGVLNTTKTIDDGSLSADFGYLVAHSVVEPFGRGLFSRDTHQLSGTEWPLLHGQDYDEKFDVILPFTQQDTPAGTDLGNPRTKIIPKDVWRQEERVINISDIAAVLDTYVMQFPGTRSLSLPPVLVSVNSIIEQHSGDGDTATPFFFGQWTTHGAYSVPIRSEGQASAAIVAKVMPIISQSHAERITTTHYLFFLPNPVTSSDVMTRLNTLVGSTVLAWPVFHLQSAAIFSVGQKTSLRVNAETHQSSGGNTGDGASEGSEVMVNAASREVGLLVESVHVPPCIHGNITIDGDTSGSQTITASADATLGGLVNSRTETETVNSSITTVGLGATDPTGIPNTGIYLIRADAEPFKYGYVSVHAEVFDASVL